MPPIDEIIRFVLNDRAAQLYTSLIITSALGASIFIYGLIRHWIRGGRGYGIMYLAAMFWLLTEVYVNGIHLYTRIWRHFDYAAARAFLEGDTWWQRLIPVQAVVLYFVYRVIMRLFGKQPPVKQYGRRADD